MNEYEKWAYEYKKSADATKEQIEICEQERSKSKSLNMKDYYNQRLQTLYCMYNDCLYSYKQLLRKAERSKK